MSPCSRVDFGDGTVAIVKHSGARHARCPFCSGSQPATQLCDEVLSRAENGKEFTCDAKVCVYCAQQVDGKDYCPRHRKERKP